MQLIYKSPYIPNIIIIQQLEVLIFYFQSYYAFYNKKATVKKIALKNPKVLKKQNFEQKSLCDIFKKMLDMNVSFLGGVKDIPWDQFKMIIRSTTHQRRPPPYTHLYSTLAYFAFVLRYFYHMKPIISKGHSKAVF